MAVAEALPRETGVPAGLIAARLDGLPMTRTLWVRVILLSLGGFFEFYDLLFTGYIAPGLVRSGILTPTTPGLFGNNGIASFVAAFFAGLFIGTLLFGFAADRLGRRTIFTVSLSLVLGGERRHGVPERRLRIESLAVHYRPRRRRRARHHRHLSRRAGAEGLSRTRLRDQPDGAVRRRSRGRLSRLAIGADSAFRDSMAGAGWW